MPDSYLKSILEDDQSRENRDKMLDYIESNPDKMSELMYFFLNEDLHWRYNQRAAWPIGILGRKYPELIEPYLPEMIAQLGHGRHDAIHRNIVRILEEVPVPEELEGALYDKCFKFLNDPDEPIAVRVFSMTVLFNIAKKHPEMLDELKQTIEMYMPHGSGGFKNRGGKIIAAIRKMNS